MLSKTEPGMKMRRGKGSNKQDCRETNSGRSGGARTDHPKTQKMPLLRMAEINVCGGNLRVIGLICQGCNNT